MRSKSIQYYLGCTLKNWSVSLALFSIYLCIFPWRCGCNTGSSQYTNKSWPQEKVPAVFAFGDSILDPGNNNQFFTVVRCDFPPYGKDFADHKATGRFSNGRIIPDFIAEELGIKKNLPAFLDPSLQEEDLLTGVSFASSGSGYDPLTSRLFFVMSLDEQLEMFKEYIERVKRIVGVERTNFILNNSISIVVAGNNDFANTYFYTPFRITQYDVHSYVDFLLNFSTSLLQELYKFGVRKIGVGSVGVMGCVPLQRTLAGGLWRECPKFLNEAAQLFNSKLKEELLSLSTKLPYSKLVYIDLYSIMLDLNLNHTHYGFKVADRGCCGSGLVELAVLCNPLSSVCEDVNKYYYWDGYHATERANQIMGHQIIDKYIPLFF